MKLMNKCKKAAILATVLGGLCLGASADAATIVIGGATDYTTGTQIGALNGSWVTSKVDTTVVQDGVVPWVNMDILFGYYGRYDELGGYNDDYCTDDYYNDMFGYRAEMWLYHMIHDNHPTFKNLTEEEFFTPDVTKSVAGIYDTVYNYIMYGSGNLNGCLANDCDIHRVVLNGKTYAYIRQTTSLGTVAMDGIVIDLSKFNSLGSSQYKGATDSVNSHGVAAKGKFIYCADYTGCRIGVGELNESENRITNRSDLTLDLQKDLAENAGIDFSDDKYYIHGESLLVDDDYLYVLTNVNKGSEWENYQPSYLIKYYIQPNGKLTYVGYTTMGKNTDTARINKFNDHIFVTAIGGYQNYGNPNASTSLDYANINEDGSFGTSGPINIPKNVQDAQTEFRNLKILPDGTAYVLCYSISEGGYKTGLNVYRTTISNLLADNPQNWQVVANDVAVGEDGDVPGWFNNVNAEYYTKRVWVRAGNNLHLYVDGKLVHTWAAKEFATSDMFTTMQAFDVMTPEGINGTLAKLDLAIGEQAADNANAVWNDSATVESITSDKTFTGDTAITADGSKVDLGNNISAAVYAKGNDITITANNLQLQSKNNIATPVGVYAGNGKEVNIKADNLNIITKGYEGGNSLTNAIWLDPGATGTQAKITIEAPVNISMTGGIGGNGIAVQKTDRWGESSTEAAEKAEVIIKGDVNVKGADNQTWGINANTENVFSRFNNAGILTAVNNSSVTVDGNVYLDVYGNGIATTAQGSTVTVNGGEITVPTGTGYGYYTLASYLGSINMNTGTDGATPGDKDVKLDGDIFALNTGKVNVALTTEASHLYGAVDSAGETNLWLQNGATWVNEANNSRYYLDSEDAGSLIGSNRASRINNFVGGNNKDDVASYGVIYQGADSENINIANYSGNAIAFYDLEAGNSIAGGTITIGNAAVDSNIILSTEYTVDMESDVVRDKVLDDMAKKLYYTAYTNNERNLNGYVHIAEGLLTSSFTKYIGDIQFSETTGQGGLLAGSVDEKQKVVESIDVSSTTLKDYASDNEYINDAGEIVLDNVVSTADETKGEIASVIELKSESTTGEAQPTINVNSEETSIVINMGGKELECYNTSTGENAQAKGIAVSNGGSVEIKEVGKISIVADNENGTAHALYAESGANITINNESKANVDNTVTLIANGNDGAVLHAEDGANVKIAGKVNILTNANNSAITATGQKTIVEIGGGKIGAEGNESTLVHVADGAKIKINKDGKHELKTYGNFVFGKEPTRSVFRLTRSAVQNNADEESNVTIWNTADSEHIGNFENIGTGEEAYEVEFSNGAKWTGNAIGMNMDVLLDNGSEWWGTFEEDDNENAALALEINNGATWKNRTENATVVNSLTGNKGYVDMVSGSDVTVNKYSGNNTFIYTHNKDENGKIGITGGNVNIIAVDGDSAVLNMAMDYVEVANEEAAQAVLNELGQKLYYQEVDKTAQAGIALASDEGVKLTGELRIAEGLLATGKKLHYADIKFGENGKALVDEATLHFGVKEESIDAKDMAETTIASTAKSAMASSVMMWRNENTDVEQRLGDLRQGSEENGIWAKYYNGSASYNENNTYYSSDYKAYQVGYDKKLANDWVVGAALSYNEADHKYTMGAKGEGEAVGVTVYGAWQGDKGHYASVSVKGSKLDNEYNAFNDMGDIELNADYSTWGLSAIAEYGRRMEQSNGFYLEPSAKLTIGRVQDTEYRGTTEKYGTMYVEQDGFNSIVGELGLGMGKRFEKGTVYTKFALAHEFAGEFGASYLDDNNHTAKSDVDFGGSWCEWQIGGNMKMNDNSYIYATYEKAFGGDAALDWRVDAGVRWTF